MQFTNGIGVRLTKDPPRVWLLLPAQPSCAQEEKSLMEPQWKAQRTWLFQWLWWFFCWRNRVHFNRLTSAPASTNLPISELNRILGGDARCSLYTLNSTDLSQSLHQLAPKSELYLFPINAFPSDLEVSQIQDLEAKLVDNGHSFHQIERLN